MKNHHKKTFTRILSLAALGALVAVQFYPFAQIASAATIPIGTRELVLKAGATDGGSLAGGTVAHQFNFDLTDTNIDPTHDLGSVKFQYCTTAAAVPGGVDCIAPDGLSTQNANLSAQSADVGGFTGITQGNENDAGDVTKFNTTIISRGAAQPIADTDASGAIEASFEFTQVVNPSTPNETFFVRISTYNSLDATGEALESGTVAASTANPIELEGTMPESLVFCTGANIDTTSGVPDCSTATLGEILFNKLFSPQDSATATSEMAASTNAGDGYSITVNGSTLTSGSNQIDPMNPTDISRLGNSQFGMNLVANDGDPDGDTVKNPNQPIVGADVTAVSDGVDLFGQAATGYDANGSYTYIDGDVVANSGFGDDVSSASNGQIYTASYIVNVPGSQPAGTYTTTLTYICTATF